MQLIVIKSYSLYKIINANDLNSFVLKTSIKKNETGLFESTKQAKID